MAESISLTAAAALEGETIAETEAAPVEAAPLEAAPVDMAPVEAAPVEAAKTAGAGSESSGTPGSAAGSASSSSRCSSGPATAPAEKAEFQYELFFCERYRPMAGWSADYLLPTDRNAYRMRGCKRTWKSAEEAGNCLLAPGWAWKEDYDEQGNKVAWRFDPSGQHTDIEGWSYAMSFNATYEGSGKGGMKKIVRWRRLVRTMVFAIDAIGLLGAAVEDGSKVNPTDFLGARLCPNADLAVVERMGRIIVEAIASASLCGEWNDVALVGLKEKMLARLTGKAPCHKETFDNMISGFVSSFRGMSNRFGDFVTSPLEAELSLTARLGEIESKFPTAEREALATIAIWRYSPELSCCSDKQDHECEFRPVQCPNPKCGERLSIKALAPHDKVCPHKLLPCEKCEELIPRGEHKVHLAAACPMREATCVFSGIGCSVAPAHAKLGEHLEQCTQAHMMLLMKCMLEQQETVKILTQRVGDLEAQNKELAALRAADFEAEEQQRDTENKAHAAVIAQVAGLDAKMVALEKKSMQDLKDLRKAADEAAGKTHKRADQVDQEARKRHETLEKSYTSDMETLRTDFVGLKTSLAALTPMRDELVAIKSSLLKSERSMETASTTSTAAEVPAQVSVKAHADEAPMRASAR